MSFLRLSVRGPVTPQNDGGGAGGLSVPTSGRRRPRFDRSLARLLPPLARHSSFDVLVLPWPLQPFLPAQALPAPWHDPLPLHELMPEQVTSSPFLSAAEATRAAPDREHPGHRSGNHHSLDAHVISPVCRCRSDVRAASRPGRFQRVLRRSLAAVTPADVFCFRCNPRGAAT